MSPIPGPPIVSTTLVQFVDSIDAAPTVRLDVNDSVSFITLSDGTTFNPPPLREAIASNMLSHGEYVSASSYGDRAVVLHLRLKAADEDGLRNLLRVLMVELNRDSNILRLQIASEPVFFLTKRSTPEDVDITDWGVDTCTVKVSLRAGPFALGLRVDQAGVSVKMDPAALTNGCYLDVNDVTGDVETPALVRFSGASAAGNGSVYLSVRRRGTPSALVFAYQAEAAATLDSVTTVTASHDTLASGAGNNTTTTTFGVLSGLLSRVIWRLTEQVEMRGTYRVLVRCKKTVAGDVVTVALADPAFGSAGPATTVTSTSYLWYDVGLVNFPHGTDSPDGYSGKYLDLSTGATSSYSRLALAAARLSGSGNFVADVALLFPADAELSVSSCGQGFTGVAAWILDGPNDTAYNLATADNTMTGFTPSFDGDLPNLQPGSNRLFMVDTYSGGVITDSMTAAVSYWPRHLAV